MKLKPLSVRHSLAAVATAMGGLALWHAGASRANGIPGTDPYTYGGIVTDDVGNPLRNASVSISIYDAAVGGTLQCSGSVTANSGLDGRFTIPLSASCTAVLNSSAPRFVEVTVGGTTLPTRTQIGAVPYAASSNVAASVTGPVAASQVISNGQSIEDRFTAIDSAGTIVATTASSCPAGTVRADGASLPRDGVYAPLFTALGTTYGAVDGTHFNLPDARGVFLRGEGTQTIGGRSHTGTRGARMNDTTARNGLSVIDVRHSHVSNNGGAGNTGPYGTSNFSGGLGNFSAQVLNLGSWTSPEYSGVTLNAGDSETAPANITVMYCIRL